VALKRDIELRNDVVTLMVASWNDVVLPALAQDAAAAAIIANTITATENAPGGGSGSDDISARVDPSETADEGTDASATVNVVAIECGADGGDIDDAVAAASVALYQLPPTS
jgi:hypothetical protein